MRAEVAGHNPAVALEVSPDTAADDALAVFDLKAGDTASDWVTDLAWLGGDYVREVWRGSGETRTEHGGECLIRRGRGLVMASISLDDDGSRDPAPLSETAYRQLYGVLGEPGPLYMVRLWNYLPAINAGNGDRERYRRFCVGRGTALSEVGIDERALCAGTAIGTRGNRFRVYCLAAAAPGVHIENPRQVSAYRYPREYGPCSPSFARATALPRTDGSVALLISGTASVVGHATVHPGDLEAQLGETVDNLDALLDSAARRFGKPALARFDERSLLRVYLRRPEAADRVLARLREAWPGARVAVLRGDICRRDLEVEIEAWHTG